MPPSAVEIQKMLLLLQETKHESIKYGMAYSSLLCQHHLQLVLLRMILLVDVSFISCSHCNIEKTNLS